MSSPITETEDQNSDKEGNERDENAHDKDFDKNYSSTNLEEEDSDMDAVKDTLSQEQGLEPNQ